MVPKIGRPILYLFLCLAFLTRCYLFFTAPKPFKDGDNIRISATIRSESLRFENSQYLKLYGLKIYLPLYPVVAYGDGVIIEGKVKADRLMAAKLVNLEKEQGILYSFRSRLLEFYNRSLPSPYSGLIAGITIGSKTGISDDFWNILKNTGTAHVVVASGMNISLVAGFLMGSLTVFVKRKKVIVFVLIGIWVYAILTGFEAPIIRSAVMGSIAFTAQELGRLNLPLRALVTSALIMLFINPNYIKDTGFLLSFFATLGLILFEPQIRKRLVFVPDILREDLSTTLSAQIGVLPILVWVFGRLNPLSPLINVLILWTVVPMTVLGMLGGLIGFIVPIAGKVILTLTFPFSWWFVGVIRIFS